MKKKRNRNKGRNTSLFYNEEEEFDSEEEHYQEDEGEPLLHTTSTFHMKSHHEPPITVHPVIEGKFIKIEVDTGAAVAVISENDSSANLILNHPVKYCELIQETQFNPWAR